MILSLYLLNFHSPKKLKNKEINFKESAFLSPGTTPNLVCVWCWLTLISMHSTNRCCPIGETFDKTEVVCLQCDVSQLGQVQKVRDEALNRFGRVDVVHNNAGIGLRAQTVDGSIENWHRLIDVNFWGVLHGVQVFTPELTKRGHSVPGLMVNTGSKQGITTPPGNTGYNVSKAGVKIVTEALAHELVSADINTKITAHLLVPGYTHTPLTDPALKNADDPSAVATPKGAWTPDQVVEFFFASLRENSFYILCPDNEVPTRKIDELRIRWNLEDIIKNRPPLSRWHPTFKDQFAKYMEENK